MRIQVGQDFLKKRNTTGAQIMKNLLRIFVLMIIGLAASAAGATTHEIAGCQVVVTPPHKYRDVRQEAYVVGENALCGLLRAKVNRLTGQGDLPDQYIHSGRSEPDYLLHMSEKDFWFSLGYSLDQSWGSDDINVKTGFVGMAEAYFNYLLSRTLLIILPILLFLFSAHNKEEVERAVRYAVNHRKMYHQRMMA